jgi:hypothetical protein
MSFTELNEAETVFRDALRDSDEADRMAGMAVRLHYEVQFDPAVSAASEAVVLELAKKAHEANQKAIAAQRRFYDVQHRLQEKGLLT